MKNEKGATIVEASLVFPIVFIIIIIMLTLGNAYYQKCRVEAIVSVNAIECAGYAQDTLLDYYKKNGKVPTNVNDMPSIEPYKYLINGTGSNINTNVADAEQNIKKQIEELNAGYYKGMEVHLESYQVSYRNYFIYQTITAKVNCRIQMPVRPLWSSEYLNYYFSVIYDIPVTDSTEFIRNVDMAVDYLEKYGVIDKIQNAMNKVKEFFGS
ncbi:MAG: hypothetical protein HFH64_09035 [Lachnospiraceae bacterium]|nr:hypothetical protein [Lachnospiraceae bacterium]